MKSLEGRILAITRDKRRAEEFSRMVQAEGGSTIPLKTIKIIPTSGNIAESFLDRIHAEKPDYCAFMSAQAVEVLSELVEPSEIQNALAKTSVIAVGPRTRSELERIGVMVSLVPREYSSKGLVEMLLQMAPIGKKIVIPRSSAAGDYAMEALRTAGMDVVEIFLYQVKSSEPSSEWKRFASQLESGKVDAVVFTSASGVIAFFEILASILPELKRLDSVTKAISIGPFTSEVLKNKNVPYFEASEHTVKGTFELARTLLSR